MKSFFALAALAAFAPHAAAQQATSIPHPADPAASVPVVKYESTFSGYRGFREEPLASWLTVNDEVVRAVGAGHGAHKPAPTPQGPRAAVAPTSPPEPARHSAGHH